MFRLLLYWNTLRYLRPIQFYWRIWQRIYKPRVDLRASPPLRALSGKEWVDPAQRRPSMLGPTRFLFLNEIHDLTSRGWDDPSLEKLWRYNLHYFDDLGAETAVSRREWHQSLLIRWVAENPPGLGTGWEPYPTSLRIVNWTKWVLGGNPLPPECIHSLAVQARWLSPRMEHHLLGNHLFANAKALVFAGLFFAGPEAEGWLEQGLSILKKEIPEQILDDGGQFERSTMYHALALEDMLDLNNLISVFAAAIPSHQQPTVTLLRERTGPMRAWLATMCHPDGEIGYFNDAARGIAPTPLVLEKYAARLGLSGPIVTHKCLTHLASSGYVRVIQDQMVGLLDVAPIGPNYLPGHAHADTLTFELSLFGQRVLVNSGTSCYGNSSERLRQRGTAAHNTVMIEGQNSSEVWSGFRVARRAVPTGLQIVPTGGIRVRCSHNGYRRLPGKPEHQREWSFTRNSIFVEDRICGEYDRAEARFHLHPEITLVGDLHQRIDETETVLRLPRGQEVIFSTTGGELHKEKSTWHPEFGRAVPNQCLVIEFRHSTIRSRLTWDRTA